MLRPQGIGHAPQGILGGAVHPLSHHRAKTACTDDMDDSRAAFPASCRHQGIQGAKGGQIGTQIGFQYPVNVAVAQLFQPREGEHEPGIVNQHVH